jgi:hypothetical protein
MALRSLTPLDRIVAALLLTMIALIVVSWWSLSVSRFVFESPVVMIYSIVTCAALVVWMTKGGANSELWNWLPPFWPWGYIAKAAWARWAIVGFLVAGSVAGIVAELTAPLPPNKSFERTREDKVPSSNIGARAAQLNR